MEECTALTCTLLKAILLSPELKAHLKDPKYRDLPRVSTVSERLAKKAFRIVPPAWEKQGVPAFYGDWSLHSHYTHAKHNRKPKSTAISDMFTNMGNAYRLQRFKMSHAMIVKSTGVPNFVCGAPKSSYICMPNKKWQCKRCNNDYNQETNGDIAFEELPDDNWACPSKSVYPFFAALHDRYKDIKIIPPYWPLLHGNYCANANLYDEVLCMATYNSGDDSVSVAVPSDDTFTSFRILQKLEDIPDALEKFDVKKKQLATDEARLVVQKIFDYLQDIRKSDIAIQKAQRHIEELEKSDIAIEKAVREALQKLITHRKKLAAQGSMVTITLSDIVSLLSVEQGQPACIEQSLVNHAAIWTSSLDENGNVVIEARDPNWTSLQLAEGFLSVINTQHIEDGWCQTWQAFDVECIRAGVRQEHDALVRAATAFCNNVDIDNTEVAPLLLLSKQLGNCRPDYALSILVNYLFLRNIELLMLCTKRQPEYLADQYEKTTERFKAHHHDKMSRLLAKHGVESQSAAANEKKKFAESEQRRLERRNTMIQKFTKQYQAQSTKLWLPLQEQNAALIHLFADIEHESTAALFVDNTLVI